MGTSIEPLLQAMTDDEGRFAGVKRLGVDEHVWHHVSEFPAYFDTGRPNNGGTEAINELHQRVARGSRNRDHYRPRMLLIGGGLTHPHLR